MANDLTRNPMIVDTAFDATETAAHASGERHITSIAWTGAPGSLITASADLVIKDGVGNVIFKKRAQSAGDDAYLHLPKAYSCQGINVDTIDTGICFIYM